MANLITKISLEIASAVISIGNDLEIQSPNGWDDFVISRESYLNIKKQYEKIMKEIYKEIYNG